MYIVFDWVYFRWCVRHHLQKAGTGGHGCWTDVVRARARRRARARASPMNPGQRCMGVEPTHDHASGRATILKSANTRSRIVRNLPHSRRQRRFAAFPNPKPSASIRMPGCTLAVLAVRHGRSRTNALEQVTLTYALGYVYASRGWDAESVSSPRTPPAAEPPLLSCQPHIVVMVRRRVPHTVGARPGGHFVMNGPTRAPRAHS